jgi:hypothetical protein
LITTATQMSEPPCVSRSWMLQKAEIPCFQMKPPIVSVSVPVYVTVARGI